MKKFFNKFKNNKGNSLAEFVVTAAMMATLATTAAPRFSGIGEGAKEKKGEKILLQSFEDQEKSIFCKGANRGIQDFAYFCESNGKPIWGLYGYLHEGKKYFELDGET